MPSKDKRPPLDGQYAVYRCEAKNRPVRPRENFIEVDRKGVDRNLFGGYSDKHASSVWMSNIISELDY